MESFPSFQKAPSFLFHIAPLLNIQQTQQRGTEKCQFKPIKISQPSEHRNLLIDTQVIQTNQDKALFELWRSSLLSWNPELRAVEILCIRVKALRARSRGQYQILRTFFKLWLQALSDDLFRYISYETLLLFFFPQVSLRQVFKDVRKNDNQ